MLVPDLSKSLPASVIHPQPIPELRVGTFQAGLGLWQLALQKAHHVFEIDEDLGQLNQWWPRRPVPAVSHTFARVPSSVLSDHPVDLLVSDFSRSDVRKSPDSRL